MLLLRGLVGPHLLDYIGENESIIPSRGAHDLYQYIFELDKIHSMYSLSYKHIC